MAEDDEKAGGGNEAEEMEEKKEGSGAVGRSPAEIPSSCWVAWGVGPTTVSADDAEEDEDESESTEGLPRLLRLVPAAWAPATC